LPWLLPLGVDPGLGTSAPRHRSGRRLVDKGVEISDISNHDDSEWTVAKEMHEGVFIRSVYFFDPDGILPEFACWTKALTEQDVSHVPATAAMAAGAMAATDVG
jgi:hypothetical protein